MTATIFIDGAGASAPGRQPPGRFWTRRAAYGLLLGASIALLEFAYYYSLVASPDRFGLGALPSLLLSWGGEGILLALVVGMFELGKAPLPLGGRQLALAIVVASTAGVLAWQALMHLVLRERFGVRIMLDYVGQPVTFGGVALYHVWLMLLFGGLAAAVYVSRQRHQRMLAELRAAELARETSQRRLAETKLAALRARIDPEFLFQTLAKLERLYEADRPEADRVLEDLIVFLRRALADVRSAPLNETLEEEK
jgi:histidine kinase